MPDCFRQARGRLVALLLPTFFLSFAVAGQASAAICRVTTAGTSGGSGSWASPMDLQTALTTSTCTEIWVAGGVYKPVVPADSSNVTINERGVSFDIPPGVAVYGGFAGTEVSRDTRDPSVNVTILSGDIDNNDANAGSTNIDETNADIQGSNSYHVVTLDGTTGTTITASTVMDGFTITGGQANGSSPQNLGGGLVCRGGGGGNECSPRLANITFIGNSATDYGGAMYNDGYQGTSSPSLSDVTFSGNIANNGGAIYNDAYQGISSPSLGNVTFSGNIATGGGGAIYDYGTNGTSSPSLSNVTFSNNAAGIGGATYDYNSNPSLSNVIMWGDTAWQNAGTSEISGTATIDHSVVQGGCPYSGACTTVSTSDPLLGPLGMHGGSTATMLIGVGSSAADAGDDTVCAAAPVNGLDQRGVTRPQGPQCDIGAVELHRICRVATTGNTSNDGSAWALPMDLQTALTNGACVEVWVAAGVYKPTSGTDRTVSFVIPPGVAVYGGFAGTEVSRDARDPSVNVTILSGDIDNNDANAGGTNIDNTYSDINGSNSYHVVTMDGHSGTKITATTILDGFTITGGYADGGYPDSVGGGLHCDGRFSGSECSPSLGHMVFIGNYARSGGALYDDGSGGISSPGLSNVTFSGNNADNFAGAMYNGGDSNGASSPTLNDVTFSGNSASNAGAMYNNGTSSGTSNPILGNVTFSNNSAGGLGGAMFNDGTTGTSSPSLGNVTFSGDNRALNAGGAMYSDGYNGTSNPTLVNVIMWADTPTEISNANGADPQISDSVVQGSGGSASWDTGLGADGGGNLDADPLLGALGMHGGYTATMVPGTAGSAIDVGSDATCAAAPVNGLDQRGVTRPQGSQCDIGAVENDVIFANGFEATP